MNTENGARKRIIAATTTLGTFMEVLDARTAELAPFPDAGMGPRSLARLVNAHPGEEMSRQASLLACLDLFGTLGGVFSVVPLLAPLSKGCVGPEPLALH